ncbi:hypothetical protein ESCO_002721 [Escovopsis weberi]|uniref:Uncharacterized protein n=1 Tax=Escovopsis weberi TaxID=150374 RepID=A0A0M9VSS6_ESCWE|nr:hypothetical protein ESCO_002721 [Escovopsis weberi]
MSPRSAAVAALALMARGISAIGPYSDGTTTLTGEPQLVGSATSNGMLLYSFNYCTTVQTTACAVTVSTGASPSPEYSTLSTLVGGSTAVVTVAVPISYPSAPGGSRETAAPSAANTDDSSAHWTADPVITPSASPDCRGRCLELHGRDSDRLVLDLDLAAAAAAAISDLCVLILRNLIVLWP